MQAVSVSQPHALLSFGLSLAPSRLDVAGVVIYEFPRAEQVYVLKLLYLFLLFLLLQYSGDFILHLFELL